MSSQNQTLPKYENDATADVVDEHADTASMILMIVGIFIPLIGFINACLHMGSQSPKAKQYAKLSLCLSVIWIVLFIITFAQYLILIA